MKPTVVTHKDFEMKIVTNEKRLEAKVNVVQTEIYQYRVVRQKLWKKGRTLANMAGM